MSVRVCAVSEMEIPHCVATLLTGRRWPFSYGFHHRVDNGARGLYAFWSSKACLYVGKSANIGKRLYQHRMQEHNPRLDQYFRAFAEQIEVSYVSQDQCASTNLLSLEGAVIRTLRPITNVANPV